MFWNGLFIFVLELYLVGTYYSSMHSCYMVLIFPFFSARNCLQE